MYGWGYEDFEKLVNASERTGSEWFPCGHRVIYRLGTLTLTVYLGRVFDGAPPTDQEVLDTAEYMGIGACATAYSDAFPVVRDPTTAFLPCPLCGHHLDWRDVTARGPYGEGLGLDDHLITEVTLTCPCGFRVHKRIADCDYPERNWRKGFARIANRRI